MSAPRDKRVLALAAAAAVLVLALGAVVWARLGGAVPSWAAFLSPGGYHPLGASSPAEQVLRSLRLAGIEHACAGESGGTAVARIELPAVDSAADIEIAWQAGLASLADAYPRANRCVVQVFDRAQPLLEITWETGSGLPPADAGNAVSLGVFGVSATPQAAGYRERAQTLADAAPTGMTALPKNALTVDIDRPGAYLDAKNRAAGLLGMDGPKGAAATLAEAAKEMRVATPGIPAIDVGQDAGIFWSAVGLRALQARSGVHGVVETAEQLRQTRPGAAKETIEAIRSVALTALAISSPASGDLSGEVRDLAEKIASAPLEAGAPSDAVLAAAASARAPASARVVRDFERVSALDARMESSTETPVRRAMAAGGGRGVVYLTPAGTSETLDPVTWPAYRRADGAVFWLAGEDGDIALTDGSLPGWAFTARRTAVVDARDAGTVLAYIETP